MKLHSKSWLYNPLAGNFLPWILAYGILMPYGNGQIDNPIVFPIALWVGSIWTIWLHAYRQAIQIEIKKKPINHSLSLFIRSLVAIAIGVVAHMIGEYSVEGKTLARGVLAAAYLGSIFWLTFDFFLNYHRGRKWDYLDQGDDDAAGTDKFFRDKKWLWISSKVVLFILCLALYNYILRLNLT